MDVPRTLLRHGARLVLNLPTWSVFLAILGLLAVGVLVYPFVTPRSPSVADLRSTVHTEVTAYETDVLAYENDVLVFVNPRQVVLDRVTTDYSPYVSPPPWRRWRLSGVWRWVPRAPVDGYTVAAATTDFGSFLFGEIPSRHVSSVEVLGADGWSTHPVSGSGFLIRLVEWRQSQPPPRVRLMAADGSVLTELLAQIAE